MTALDAIRSAVGHRTVDSLPPLDQKFLRECADMNADGRCDRYALFETYYDGDQNYPLTDRQRAYLENVSGLPYVENVCAPVVDAHAGRQIVKGFAVRDDEDASEWLSDHFDRNARLGDEPVQDTVHHGVYKRGDEFVLFEPDHERGLVRALRQSPHRCKPLYGDGGELEGMVKVWDASGRSALGPQNPAGSDGQPAVRAIRRMNLYYADRVEKYFTTSKGDGATWGYWIDFDDREPVYETDDATGAVVEDDDGDPVQSYDPQGAPLFRELWPTPWTMDGEPDGEPIGIPWVHFKRKANGGEYGTSKLRSVVPQQDAFMKTMLDLANVLDHAFPIPYVKGLSDTNTELTVAAGDILRLPGAEADAGILAAADPRPLVETYEATIRRVCALSFTALHALLPGATMPTGESLKTAEAPQTKALEDDQGPLGNQHARGMWLTHRIATAFADELFDGGEKAPPELAPDAVITTLWEPVASRNDESEVTVAEAKQRLGVSQHTLIRELGYDPDEEAKLRAKEQKASLTAAKAAFNRGRLPGDEPPDDEDIDDRADGQK